MMSEWHKVSQKIPDDGRKIEVVGYHTICCHLDADSGITIQEAKYKQSKELFETDEGYFILPLYWRYLDE